MNSRWKFGHKIVRALTLTEEIESWDIGFDLNGLIIILG